jgi:hypothetical protein
MMTKSSNALRFATLALIALSSFPVYGQTDGHVLVGGRNPLTVGITDKTGGFFEWALDLQFTPEQKARYRDMMIRNWASAQKRQSMLEILPTIDKLWVSPPETRARVKAQFSQALLESLRKNQENEQARWLLAIYDAGHGKAAGVQQTSAVADSEAVKALVGKWRTTSVAATQYKNAYTGAPAPTSGNSFHYEFLADATYRSNNLMQVTTYGCTSSIYGESSGRFRIVGDHLSIEPARGTVRSQVCGGQPSEKADSLARREYAFQIERTDGREILVINGVDGKTRPDYYRREGQ